MKILQLAPLWERVPPPAYGGIEYVVSVLTEELVRRGHEVVLAASGDSLTSARLQSVYEPSLRTAGRVHDPQPYLWLHSALALRAASHFDLIHNHAGELPMAMQPLTTTPMLTTLHNLITPELQPVWAAYRGHYNTPSRAAASTVHHPNFAGVVYHGIDVATFPFHGDRGDYLLFLSRMSEEKGPLAAIEVARRLGKPLLMAGKVDAKDHAFFHREVAPLIDGRRVRYLGEADWHTKRDLYARAMCLLFPITWDEPFGLVLAEAMACGTPAVTFRWGAAPEIVADGVTGYVVDDVDAMVRAVKRVDRIDPRRCREHVERRFSSRLMGESYVRLYERILEGHHARRRRVFAATPAGAALAG